MGRLLARKMLWFHLEVFTLPLVCWAVGKKSRWIFTHSAAEGQWNPIVLLPFLGTGQLIAWGCSSLHFQPLSEGATFSLWGHLVSVIIWAMYFVTSLLDSSSYQVPCAPWCWKNLGPLVSKLVWDRSPRLASLTMFHLPLPERPVLLWIGWKSPTNLWKEGWKVALLAHWVHNCKHA